MSDLISRQAAIKATWQDTGYTDPFNVMTAIRDRIQQLPPANTSEIPNSSDTISRQAAIDALKDWCGMFISSFRGIAKVIDAVPSAQPEIIRCRNCKFASGDSRICMKFGHSPIGELDFCAWAERRTDG